MVSSHSSPARKATQVTFNVRNCNVLVVGGIGAGKSTICNQIIGEEWFKCNSGRSDTSVTRLSMRTSQVRRIVPDNIMYDIKVIDIDNGFFNNDDVYQDVKTYMQDHVPEGASLVLFVMRKGHFTGEMRATFDLIMENVCGISPISALVMTCCEGMTEEGRERLVGEFHDNQHTSNIAKFMQKGIYPVGFPDLSTMNPELASLYEEDMAADAKTLRNLMFRSTDMLPTKLLFFEKHKSMCNIL